MEWIPVVSNLPAEGSFVLVSVNRMCVDIAYYSLGKFIINANVFYPDAWMMLPEPYCIGKHEKGYHARMERMNKLKKYGVIN